MPDTTAVSIKNVSKQFDNIEVLRDINLTVEKGSVVSILGSSGSGKSTLLRCMNWLEQPDRGEIHIGGQRLGIDEQNGKAMSHRQLSKIRERVGMVFQSFNLWPHLTVQQNVSEALLHAMKRLQSPYSSWKRSGWRTRPTPGRLPSPAGRSSGWPLPVRWRCRRK